MCGTVNTLLACFCSLLVLAIHAAPVSKNDLGMYYFYLLKKSIYDASNEYIMCKYNVCA